MHLILSFIAIIFICLCVIVSVEKSSYWTTIDIDDPRRWSCHRTSIALLLWKRNITLETGQRQDNFCIYLHLSFRKRIPPFVRVLMEVIRFDGVIFDGSMCIILHFTEQLKFCWRRQWQNAFDWWSVIEWYNIFTQKMKEKSYWDIITR